MAKTNEEIRCYNKEYFARPEVKARAKIRNAKRRNKRKLYKKTEKGREAENRYRRGNFKRDAVKSRVLFKRYGINIEEYKLLLEAQNGQCAICKLKTDQCLHVDHCHKTKKVRGLLCGSCNRALGLLKDDVTLLKKAINYLKRCLTN